LNGPTSKARSWRGGEGKGVRNGKEEGGKGTKREERREGEAKGKGSRIPPGSSILL